jgi:hypothetical protein
LNSLRVNSFGRELYESFCRIRGVPIALVALVLGLVYFYFSGNQSTIRLIIALPIFIGALIILWTLLDLSLHLHKNATRHLPRVVQARTPPTIYPGAVAILLLEGSEVYGHESLVSVYYRDDGFEVLIGIGFVLTRQDDGLIQVVISRQLEETYKDVWLKVCQNDATILPRLLVKPSLPKLFAEGVLP